MTTIEQLLALDQRLDEKIKGSNLGRAYFEEHSSGAEIAAVAAAAASIIIQFSKGNDIIEEIRAKIDKLIGLLEEVIWKLDNLPVFIKEEFRYYVETQLLSALSLMRISDPTWAAWIKGKDEEKRREARRQIFDVFKELSIKSNDARRYGYKHYMYMATAAAALLRLGKLYGADPESLRVICDDFIAYFTECITLDSAEKETYGTLHKSLNAQMEDLANKYVAKTFTWDQSQQEDWCRVTYENNVVVSGSIQQGFSFHPTSKRIRSICRREPTPRGLVNDPPPPYSYHQIMNDYNTAKIKYDDLILMDTKVKDVIASIINFIDTIGKVKKAQ